MIIFTYVSILSFYLFMGSTVNLSSPVPQIVSLVLATLYIIVFLKRKSSLSTLIIALLYLVSCIIRYLYYDTTYYFSSVTNDPTQYHLPAAVSIGPLSTSFDYLFDSSKVTGRLTHIYLALINYITAAPTSTERTHLQSNFVSLQQTIYFVHSLLYLFILLPLRRITALLGISKSHFSAQTFLLLFNPFIFLNILQAKKELFLVFVVLFTILYFLNPPFNLFNRLVAFSTVSAVLYLERFYLLIITPLFLCPHLIKLINTRLRFLIVLITLSIISFTIHRYSLLPMLSTWLSRAEAGDIGTSVFPLYGGFSSFLRVILSPAPFRYIMQPDLDANLFAFTSLLIPITFITFVFRIAKRNNLPTYIVSFLLMVVIFSLFLPYHTTLKCVILSIYAIIFYTPSVASSHEFSPYDR